MTHTQDATALADELLPCPLCHSGGDLLSRGTCYLDGSSDRQDAVRCINCGCRATLTAWNTRAAPQTPDVRAAVIEECAKIAETQAKEFLSPEYAAFQPSGSSCERFACNRVAAAIRNLLYPNPTDAPAVSTSGNPASWIITFSDEPEVSASVVSRPECK